MAGALGYTFPYIKQTPTEASADFRQRWKTLRHRLRNFTAVHCCDAQSTNVAVSTCLTVSAAAQPICLSVRVPLLGNVDGCGRIRLPQVDDVIPLRMWDTTCRAFRESLQHPIYVNIRHEGSVRFASMRSGIPVMSHPLAIQGLPNRFCLCLVCHCCHCCCSFAVSSNSEPKRRRSLAASSGFVLAELVNPLPGIEHRDRVSTYLHWGCGVPQDEAQLPLVI